jgi:hypothetical protein
VTAAIWTAGGVILVVAALLPLLAAVRRRRRAAATGRDRAEALLSRLDLAIDRAGTDSGRAAVPAADLREAERCRTLAGAALAGTPTAADTARARSWAQAGLRTLHATDPA